MPNSSVCDARNQGVRYIRGDSCSDSCVESQFHFCCMWHSSQWVLPLGMLNSLGTQGSKSGANPYEAGLCVPLVAFATVRWFHLGTGHTAVVDLSTRLCSVFETCVAFPVFDSFSDSCGRAWRSTEHTLQVVHPSLASQFCYSCVLATTAATPASPVLCHFELLHDLCPRCLSFTRNKKSSSSSSSP